jgi:hypothetical protein
MHIYSKLIVVSLMHFQNVIRTIANPRVATRPCGSSSIELMAKNPRPEASECKCNYKHHQ